MNSEQDGTPLDEFAFDEVRKNMERREAIRIRDAIVEGYRDAIEGNTVEYRGNLRSLMKQRRC